MKNFICTLALSLLLVGCHGGYDVTPDTVPPVIIAPAAITIAAVDALGTPATDTTITAFVGTVTASDNVDGAIAVFNDAPSVFPLGDTTVTFTATDSAGNKLSVSVVVTIADLTAPVLTLPGDIVIEATMLEGVEVSRGDVVDFLNGATASDNVDISVDISNDAPTDVFPFGDTTVEFSATDAAGNTATGTAVVTVVGEIQEGSAVKGPLHKAIVFFDYDDDEELDENEPFTLTAKDGSYALAEGANAPDDYFIVLVMGPDTVDYISGESYADSGIVLKAMRGGSVITPLTTLYVETQNVIEEGEVFSEEQFIKALNLPEEIELKDYNPYALDEDTAEYIDVDFAQEVEAATQSFTTALIVMAETVLGVSEAALGVGTSISRQDAIDVALEAIAVITVESEKIIAGETSEFVDRIDGPLDFTEEGHIIEIEEVILGELNDVENSTFSAALDKASNGGDIDIEVATAVGEFTFGLATDTIVNISTAFDDLEGEEFGTIEASSVSVTKVQAKVEVDESNQIVLDRLDDFRNGVIDDFNEETINVTGVVTLNEQSALDTNIELNKVEVTAHVVSTIEPEFTSPGTFNVPENQTAIGQVVVADTEGEALTFVLSGTDAADLMISEEGVLSFNVAPDFETKSSYSVIVTVSDGINEVSQTISLLISDENDGAPRVTSEGGFVVDENQTEIGAVTATNLQGDALTFSLSGPDAGLISIDADSGVLSFNSPADYETQRNFFLIVAINDGTNETVTSVTVSLLNLNDSVPVFNDPVLTVGDRYLFLVPENDKSVGFIQATDPDFDILSYSLTGNDLAHLQVDPELGVITFIRAPDYEERFVYNSTIVATDGINSIQQDFQINVEDKLEEKAFRMASNKVTLTDFDPATQIPESDRLRATVTDSVMNTDLSVKPLTLLNLQNALVEGDFHTPTLNSELDNLPVGSGTETATISLFDGSDSTRESGERQVSIELTFDWTSDGEIALFNVPAQVIDMVYINALDTVIDLQVENEFANSFTVTKEGINYPATLDQTFLNALAKFTDLPLDELLDSGTYTFQLITSMPFTYVDGSTVTQIDAIVKIEADQ